MEQFIAVRDKTFTISDIKNGSYVDVVNDYEKTSLDFCKDWLLGKEEFIITTSGSTGVPKALKISAGKIKQSVHMTAIALGLERGMNALVCLNTDFIAGKMMLARGMELGMNMNIVSPASNPLQHIQSTLMFDFTGLVPLQAETILKTYPEGKKSII